jgi:serine phosphatase RsbU (regulator of sigma subunit)
LTFVPIFYKISALFRIGNKMTAPSLRKLEFDLDVNKTTLHNWKKNRPKLYDFIIESYKDREILKKHLALLIEQKELIEKEIDITKNRIN